MVVVICLEVLRDPVWALQHPACMPSILNALFWLGASFVMGPRVREAILLRLGALSNPERHQSLISSLLRLKDAPHDIDEVLKRTKANFRAINIEKVNQDQAHEIDLNDPRARLSSFSSVEEYGSVCAFVSHSHHDDGKAKWRALLEWSARFKAEYGCSPTLWIDKVRALMAVTPLRHTLLPFVPSFAAMHWPAAVTRVAAWW